MKFLKCLMAALVALWFALGGSVWAQEAVGSNSIENLNVAQQGGDILIKIDLKDALATPPAGFSVANPARIAFDFPGTINGLGRSSQKVNEGDLKSFNIVQVGNRTRLVLNLVRNMNYSTRIDGKSLYVTLSNVGQAIDSDAQKATRFAEERAVGMQHAIRDIIFRRGKDGEGRIIVELSDSGTGIDIRQQGSVLVVDFLKTSLPENLQRKLDVTDFATPVTSVATGSQSGNVRMTISPNGLWEHSAYQSDNQFVIEVKRIAEDPNKLVQGSKLGFQGQRVSINYQNGDVRALLRLMAEELGLNAVINETVSGSITLVLKDVPADQVIDIIFQQKGLDMRKSGNVILIAPRDEIATREKLEFESKQQISDLEPMRTETFQLNYQKADEVAKILTTPTQGGGANTGSQRLLSKRGSVIWDTKTNTIFVNDIASKLEEVRSFLKVVDVNSRQVLIEARVVEANDSFNKTLGVRMNFLTRTVQQIGNTGIGIGGGNFSPATRTSSTSIAADGTASTTTTIKPAIQNTPQTGGVNLPSYAATGGTLALSLFNASFTNILNLELAALEADGGGKIISSPRVITANNVKAKIEDGSEIPYTVNTCSTNGCTATVSFKSAKLSLEATPQITPEGTVRMKLVVKKEEPDFSKSTLTPALKSTVVETDVVVDNGGTLVVGGVFTSNNATANEKVPLLGDIPVLGYLFKYQQTVGSRRELLVFITPRIVNDQLSVR